MAVQVEVSITEEDLSGTEQQSDNLQLMVDVQPVPGSPTERSASADPLLVSQEKGPDNQQSVMDPLDPMETIEKRIRTVLKTRPSVRMGTRQINVSSPIHNKPFTRNNKVRHTMPTRTPTLSANSLRDPTVRRKQLLKTNNQPSSFSLNDGFLLQKINTQSPSHQEHEIVNEPSSDVSTTQTSIFVQDVEPVNSPSRTMTPSSEVYSDTIQRNNELRKSTMLLKDRILKHRQTMDRIEDQKVVKADCISDWRYVKWPKLKSWLQVQSSRRLWKSHLKEVEGHFGTAVVSYFIFLRWVFIMNLLIFVLWFSIICIPEIVDFTSRNINTTSEASCIFEFDNFDNYTCAKSAQIVYSQQINCTTDTFEVRTCLFDDEEAFKESKDVLTVTSQPIGFNCEISDDAFDDLNLTSYVLCPNVQPNLEWYTYIVDFVSGTGIFNETILFHGVYPNTSLNRFSFDLAFLFMVGLIYIISIILLVFKMGDAFNESYVQFGKKRKVNFCNKLFTAWDFNITHFKTANLKKAHIKIDFQEELLDIKARESTRTTKELALVIFIRIWTNLFVLVSLVGAGAAIYYTAIFELELSTSENNNVPIIGEYLSAIVISVLNALYPFVFSLIARAEQYKTGSDAVTITLVRTILVRLSSLLVLLSSLYNVISRCTRVVESDDDATECTFSTLTGTFLTNITNSTSDDVCPDCWETFIGQQFFRLALTNLVVALGSTLVIETGRNFASYIVKKIEYKNLNMHLKKLVTRGNFNIPKSILDLIYTQSLMWLGFLFSPLLPFIILLTSCGLFYIKKYSLIFNLEPNKKGFARSARTNFMFLFLMLLALFASAIPVLYAVTQLKPSTSCGPFRGQDTMYQSITLVIERFSCPIQIAIDFFNSAAFVVPLVIMLLLMLFAMIVVLKARNARFQLIKKQLFLEGSNVTHIVGHLDTVLSTLAEERARQNAQQRYSQNPQYLDDLTKRYSKQPSGRPYSSGMLTTDI